MGGSKTPTTSKMEFFLVLLKGGGPRYASELHLNYLDVLAGY